MEEKNPIFLKDNENLQLLMWHKSIYLFEIEGKRENALTLLHEALNLTYDSKKAMSEREMEILLSIGALELTGENHEKSLAIFNVVKSNLRTFKKLQDKSIKTRLLLNIGRVLTRLGKYRESRECCEEAVKWCIEEENLYGLGQVHYHIGYNFELEENYDKALYYIDKTLLIFDMLQDEKYFVYLNKKKDEIKDKMNLVTT
jgi:tetratricopeptide (TPR) repeat protein